MTIFADSSALVKFYADEEHHEAIRSIAEPIVVSHIARVEVPAALWRKHRLGELAAEDAALLTESFETDLSGTATEAPRFAALPVGEPVLAGAARLVAVHGLRAYDAIQLASARLARSVLDDCASFAAFDQRLRAAAAAEGFNLLPPR